MNDAPRDARVLPPSALLEETAARVAAEAGLDLVVLFGSAATGARPVPEDLDIALRATASGATLDLVALTNRFIALLGRQDIDLVDLRRADPVVLAVVARDGVVLYARDAATFTSFTSLAMRRFADTRKFREAAEDAFRYRLRNTGDAA